MGIYSRLGWLTHPGLESFLGETLSKNMYGVEAGYAPNGLQYLCAEQSKRQRVLTILEGWLPQLQVLLDAQ